MYAFPRMEILSVLLCSLRETSGDLGQVKSKIKLKIPSEVTHTCNKRNYLCACSSMLEEFP